MTTYYGVMSEFYDDGTVKTAITTRQCREKPRNTSRELPIMDAYIDWFDTRTAAEIMR